MQLKNLQKKVRDLTNDSRSKKSQIEQQESQIKSLEDKLKQREADLASEAKKVKTLEEDLVKARKSTLSTANNTASAHDNQNKPLIENSTSNAEGTLKKSCYKELELLALVGRKERISHLDLCKRVKDDVTGLLKPWV